jgi:hypothetical protein
LQTCDACICQASILSNMTEPYVATATAYGRMAMVSNDPSSVAGQYRHVDTGDEDGIHRGPAPPRTYITVRWLCHSLAVARKSPVALHLPPLLSSRVVNLAHKLASFSPLSSCGRARAGCLFLGSGEGGITAHCIERMLLV